jgi:hypothetical protein
LGSELRWKDDRLDEEMTNEMIMMRLHACMQIYFCVDIHAYGINFDDLSIYLATVGSCDGDVQVPRSFVCRVTLLRFTIATVGFFAMCTRFLLWLDNHRFKQGLGSMTKNPHAGTGVEVK